MFIIDELSEMARHGGKCKKNRKQDTNIIILEQTDLWVVSEIYNCRNITFKHSD